LRLAAAQASLVSFPQRKLLAHFTILFFATKIA
jgi:hypothetical protein